MSTHHPHKADLKPPPNAWDFPRELGSAHAQEALGTTSVAILAGFSLTAAVMEAAEQGAWAQCSVAMFGCAVALFIICLRVIVSAQNYNAVPAIRLDYAPAAKFDEDHLERLRRTQYQDEYLLDLYDKRIRRWSAAGITASLLGLSSGILAHNLTPGVAVGAAVPALVAALEALRFFGREPWLLCPAPLNDKNAKTAVGGLRSVRHPRLALDYRPRPLDAASRRALVEQQTTAALDASGGAGD